MNYSAEYVSDTAGDASPWHSCLFVGQCCALAWQMRAPTLSPICEVGVQLAGHAHMVMRKAQHILGGNAHFVKYPCVRIHINWGSESDYYRQRESVVEAGMGPEGGCSHISLGVSRATPSTVATTATAQHDTTVQAAQGQ